MTSLVGLSTSITMFDWHIIKHYKQLYSSDNNNLLDSGTHIVSYMMLILVFDFSDTSILTFIILFVCFDNQCFVYHYYKNNSRMLKIMVSFCFIWSM